MGKLPKKLTQHTAERVSTRVTDWRDPAYRGVSFWLTPVVMMRVPFLSPHPEETILLYHAILVVLN